MNRALALAATVLVMATVPGYAEAAERWAAPNGQGTACTRAAPCRLLQAADPATSADVLFIRGDRGPYRLLQTSISTHAIEVHGVFGRPQLFFSNAGDSGFLALTPTVSHVDNLRIEAPADALELPFGGEARDVVAVTTGTSETSCFVRDVILTNVLCWARGAGATALEDRADAGSNDVTDLRNTTAIASGVNGVAIRAAVTGSHSSSMSLTNVIARGGGGSFGVDLETATDNSPSASAQITTDHSNFVTHVGLGTGAQDPLPTGQTAAPVFVDAAHGDFHQACGSPTIDHGAELLGLPATDFDGDPRVVNNAPDIGADEFVPGPVAVTQRATKITPTGATLTGAIHPRGCAVKYHFEYGLTTAYGRRTPDQTLARASSPRFVGAGAGPLVGATRYHFRLVATSGPRTARGADRTFTTVDSFAGVKILSKAASVRRGRARIRVRCPVGAASICTGTLRLRTAGKVRLRRGARRRVVALGRKRFSIPVGRTARVSVKLSRAGRRLLKKRRKLKARARAVATDAFGKGGTTNRRVTLRRPR
jgi:hypothetical protein